MKFYRIKNWSEIYENNRSRTVKDLAWVAMPNRHDGFNYAKIITHEKGAELFTAWILCIQVASRCQPRGSLVRDDGKPHDSASLSLKTRAPKAWFDFALDWLSKNTDWLDVQNVAGACQSTDAGVAPSCQAGDEERTEQKEGREGALSLVSDGLEAHIPSEAEFLSAFMGKAIPEAYLKEKFRYFNDNNVWLNSFGQLVNWRSKVSGWWESGRETWLKRNRTEATPKAKPGEFLFNGKTYKTREEYERAMVEYASCQ